MFETKTVFGEDAAEFAYDYTSSRIAAISNAVLKCIADYSNGAIEIYLTIEIHTPKRNDLRVGKRGGLLLEKGIYDAEMRISNDLLNLRQSVPTSEDQSHQSQLANSL